MSRAVARTGPLTAEIHDRRNAAQIQDVTDQLAGLDRIGVAFSGGVDSTVLLTLAARALGPDATVAIIGRSASLAARDRDLAHDLARSLGVPVAEVATNELENPNYRRNHADRCFHCKDELFVRIGSDVVDAWRLDAVAFGEILDDQLANDRPGSAAATRHRILRPLATAGMTKVDVRAIARALGLPNHDKPAAPCLASRIPTFTPVDATILRQVEVAEQAMHELGFDDVRVRHHGRLARIEVPVDRFAEILATSTAVRAALRDAGFDTVALDLSGRAR
jgi:uncharacterized protein